MKLLSHYDLPFATNVTILLIKFINKTNNKIPKFEVCLLCYYVLLKLSTFGTNRKNFNWEFKKESKNN